MNFSLRDTKIINVKTYPVVCGLFFVQLYFHDHRFEGWDGYVQAALHVLEVRPGVGPEDRHGDVLVLGVSDHQVGVGVRPAYVEGEFHAHVHVGGRPLQRGDGVYLGAIL